MKKFIPLLLMMMAIAAALGAALHSKVRHENTAASSNDRKASSQRMALPGTRNREIESVTSQDRMQQLLDQSATEPEAACKEALANLPEALAAVLAEWAAKDPAMAERWVMSLEGAAREKALALLATELVRIDLEAAGRIAAAMGEGPEKNQLMAFVAAQWAATDADGAMQWLSELPEGEMRTAVERRAIPAIASTEPLLAVQYAMTQMTDPALRAVVIPEIISRWVQLDAPSAADWVQQMNSMDFGARSLKNLVSIWKSLDADESEAWIASLPSGEMRTQAEAAFQGMR